MGSMGTTERVLIIGNNITSMLHFRGPLIRAMVDRGFDVHLLVPDERANIRSSYEAQLQELAELGARVHEYPLKRSGTSMSEDVRSFFAMFHAIRAIRPDVVFAYMIKPVIYGMLAARIVGVRRRHAMLDGLGAAYTEKSDGRLPADRVSVIARRLLKAGLRQAHGLIVLNSDDAATLRRAGTIDASLPVTSVAGTGLDLRHYFHKPADPRNRTFLMIARLLIEKGVQEFAEAAEIVRRTRPDARFVLIGEPDPARSAIDVDALRRSPHLSLLEPTSDVRPALQDCFVYALPSYREGRPRTVMEAMATGRACIVSDRPGMRDCIENGRTGTLVPAMSPKALADAMLSYLDAPEKALAQGAEARRIAEATFEESKVVNDTLAAIFGDSAQ